ncbi:MAG: hypothetical protein LBH46_00170 [Rickettsiales bacterium]|jgi:F-type H+-transporting ATPase subunit b|nr:hypothetical protein [Rickettsiales bacterium]
MELYTLIAQIVNFVIFSFILFMLLYKPFVNILDKRNKDLEEKFKEGEEKVLMAEKSKEEYYDKIKNVEKEIEELKEKSLAETLKYKEEEIEKINLEIEEIRDRAISSIAENKQHLVDNFNKNFGGVFQDYVNGILRSLSNTTLKEQAINVFIDKISANNKIKDFDCFDIASNFELDDCDKQKIKSAFGEDVNVSYSKVDDIYLGFELKTKGLVFSWNSKEITDEFIKKITNL